MAEVKPNIGDRTEKELQPKDFKLSTFIEIFTGEAKNIVKFDEKVQFTYVDDLGPVTTANPGSWPLILQRFIDRYERHGKILQLKVNHTMTPGSQAPSTMLPRPIIQSSTESDGASRYETDGREENFGTPAAAALL